MEQLSTLNVRISREDISSAFEPFVRHHFYASDIRWIRRVFQSWRKKFSEYVRQKFLPGGKTTLGGPQQKVKAAYENFWGDTVLSEHLSKEGKATPCLWGNDRMLARGIGTKRVHLMLLKRALEAINPRDVLEVGSGYGINLFILAGYFPEVHFSGVELTKQGLLAAKAIGHTSSMPKEIVEFAQDRFLDVTAHQRVNFFQGSAVHLPFANDSFDVVYTVLALEAMEEIRHQALRELGRVARKYVIMIEPFLEFNDRGIRYYYHTRQQYFRGKINELHQDGLDPVWVYSDIPHKIRLWPAMVIARPR
jgi:ubiquinone/menaquinone biosynthesis C-methylase UbiE